MALTYLDQQGILNSQLKRKGFASTVEVRSFDGLTDPFLIFVDSGLAAHGGFHYLRHIIEGTTSVEDLIAICDEENNLSLTQLSFS